MATKKTATAEMFEFPAFDMTKMADSYREMADKSVNQTKEAYAKVKAAAEDTTKAIEATLENAQAGTVELSLKAIDTARMNAEASLSHMEALLGVKSVAQMFELQTAFMRKQAELMVDQTKVMQEAAKKVAEDVSKPVKAVSEKAMTEFKVA
jgi:phasin